MDGFHAYPFVSGNFCLRTPKQKVFKYPPPLRIRQGVKGAAQLLKLFHPLYQFLC